MNGLSQISMRDKIFMLEDHMREQEQVELPVVHHFSPGVYARELHIPAGVLLTGKIHKYAQLNILSAGEMVLITEDGPKHIQAPFTVVSPAGTKRAAQALTDCVWTTVHGTDLTDVDKIEAHFIAQDEAEYLEFCKPLITEET